jgi:hypothetical protein
MSDYPAFGKVPRLFRDVTITEKIDGTNGLISIEEFPWGTFANPEIRPINGQKTAVSVATGPDGFPLYEYTVRAGSRNRWISPESDNAGFSRWVLSNRARLANLLGPGNHYGEWWGQGIQRGYGKTQKNFSLFNTRRWAPVVGEHGLEGFESLRVVPTLAEGPFSTFLVEQALAELEVKGSQASPLFMKPEGVIVYHHASNHLYKATLERDEQPKTVVAP